MSKALDEVMQYSNEDVASIEKHWIIFVRTAVSELIRMIIVIWIYWKIKHWLDPIADGLNEIIPQIPFQIKRYLFPIILVYLIVSIIKRFIECYVEYKTVGLSVNNIQIRGKSGLVSVGVVNASLEQINRVNVHIPFWGRLFGYGTIEISLGQTSFSMTNMIEVAKFQNTIILLQEAQKEGRSIREAERNAETIKHQTMAQVQAIEGITHSISEGISQNRNIAIDSDTNYETHSET